MHQRPPADLYDMDGLLSSASMGQQPAGVRVEPDVEGGRYHGGYHGGAEEEEAGAAGQTGIGLLDDVFGSAEPEAAPPLAADTESRMTAAAAAAAHPSDMARLQQEHTTSGYRDGVTAGKAASSQAGFDEGYTLGAALGSAAGELLGLLEGIAAGVPADSSGREGGSESARLLSEARRELTVQSIYGPAYFALDGTWTYEIEAVVSDGTGAQAQAQEQKQEEEHTILDVARAHPLIRKWRQLVDAHARHWGIVLDDGDAAVKAALGLGDEDEGEAVDGAETTSSRHVPAASASSLDW